MSLSEKGHRSLGQGHLPATQKEQVSLPMMLSHTTWEPRLTAGTTQGARACCPASSGLSHSQSSRSGTYMRG